MIKIESVEIKWEYDEAYDVSYLDRTPEDHYGKDGCNWNHVSETDKAAIIEKHGSIMAACEYYAEQDQERLKDFYAGEWHMAGCVAKAVVSYPWGNCRRLQNFSSAGLWGIESDSDKEYCHEVEFEQLDDLRDHLKQFGVDISNFWEKYEEGSG